MNYVSTDNTRIKHYRSSILLGLIHRLSILTTITKENQNRIIDILYPAHAETLKRIGLTERNFKCPTLKNSKEKTQVEINNKQRMTSNPTPEYRDSHVKKQYDSQQNTWFCIRYNNIWGIMVSTRIHELCNFF